ncbi:hypothetical protein SAMN05216223_12381 [Actinacidiphila yanglinensis]|uniref:Uncharacterized protein n=1 Tax=Actinacidiphila yanglinensis TaxID=310779 RepID=A0A1H6E1V4_9ACTN|nr:hypothetical protein [Actinacidiphila yanglinensis]SEG91319.1 hypothetical protein SAMN05216223_12381 [Actinacidiphila yanglinensis]
MGLPDKDRLENLCQTDMEAIEAEISDIRGAIKQVHAAMGAKTWVGGPADKWATDFNGRMGALSRLFGTFPDEEQRLIAKAQASQDAKDRKARGAA